MLNFWWKVTFVGSHYYVYYFHTLWLILRFDLCNDAFRFQFLYLFCRNCDGMQSGRFRWAHHGWSVLVQVSMIYNRTIRLFSTSEYLILSKRNLTRLFSTDWRLNSAGAYGTMIHRKISMKVHVFSSYGYHLQ